MQLEIFKTLWGFKGSYAEAAQQALAAGFHGIEGAAPTGPAQRSALARILEEYGLAYIGEICTAGGYVPDRRATRHEHIQSLETQLSRHKELRPRFINCIAGCDAWSLDENLAFFDACLELEARHGVTLSFETHRSRSLFNPWVTEAITRRLPELRLTCDFSHWCVVCERLMDTELDVVEHLAGQAHHIHARVGYDQGPQVPHPAAPEYADCLAAHQHWWEILWASQLKRGFPVSTLTPEFGPDGYLHELPFLRAPVAELWSVNQWMGQTEIGHFERFMQQATTAAPAMMAAPG